MRYILIFILILWYNLSYGQGVSNFGATRSQDTSKTKGQVRFEAYTDTDTTIAVFLANGTVKKIPISRINSGGSNADSSVFVTVTRLRDSLTNYLRKSDSNLYVTVSRLRDTSIAIRGAIQYYTNGYGLTLSGNVFAVDTSLISTLYDVSLKLNISDTAAMLAPYLRKGDSNLYATQYDLTQLIQDTNFVRTVAASSGVSNIGNSKNVHLVADTSVLATQYDIAGKVDTGSNSYVKNQTLSQQNATYWIDSGYINTVTPSPVPLKIYFYGDSRTQGFGLSSIYLRWATKVANYFGYEEVNNALSGTTLSKRAPIDFFASPNMVDNAPNIVTYDNTRDAYLVIAYGYNDVRYNGGSYDSANFRTDYNTVLDIAMITKGWPASRILLVNIWYNTPTSYTAIAPAAPATETRHKSFNFVIQTLAQQRGTLYYDSYEFMKRNIGAYGFQVADSIHDNASSEQVKAAGAIKILAYNVPKKGQRFAVNGLSELSDLRYHGQDTATLNTIPIGVNDSAKIVRLYNKLIENNNTGKPQGANIQINGKIGVEAVPITNEEGLNGVGLRVNYGRFMGGYTGSTSSGAALNLYYSNASSHILSYNHNTPAPTPLYIQELAGAFTIIGKTTNNGFGARLQSPMIDAPSLRVGADGDDIWSGGQGMELRYASSVGGLLYARDITGVNAKPLILGLNSLSSSPVTVGGLIDGTGRKFQVTGVTGSSDTIISGVALRAPKAFLNTPTATTTIDTIIRWNTSTKELEKVGFAAGTNYVAPSGLTSYLLIANIVTEETPNGTINGINTAFTLDFTPVTGTVKLYLNGQRLTSGVDFTISGVNITAINIPLTGDKYFADYIKQ